MLHNVMSIFTFMGASVVRQDDSYSFEVITKTLDTVIPALIQVCAYSVLSVLTHDMIGGKQIEDKFVKETLLIVTQHDHEQLIHLALSLFPQSTRLEELNGSLLLALKLAYYSFSKNLSETPIGHATVLYCSSVANIVYGL